jgi:hypothetical protein
MNHIENHPQAYLDSNSKVIAVYLFNSHENELINEIKNNIGAIEVVDCCEYGDTGAGSYFYNNVFYPSKPYESWIFDEENKNWKAPVEKPNDYKKYQWDEDSNSWIAFIPEQPFNSWIWNEDIWLWQPPIPYPIFDPEDPRYYQWNEEILIWEEIQVSE